MCVEMPTRLFVLMAVGNESGDQMHDNIDRTAMARVLNLRDILELVDDRLDDGSFAHQQFIRKVHEMVLHVFAQPGNEVESLLKEQLGEGSRDGAAIPKQLAVQPFDQGRNRNAIIDVAWRKATGQPFASIIDCQRCSLKPKNQPMLVFPRLASTAKT